MGILEAIGDTPMVRLDRVVPPNCAEIFARLEWENPAGSMKDRMAAAVIARAEEDGRTTKKLILDMIEVARGFAAHAERRGSEPPWSI